MPIDFNLSILGGRLTDDPKDIANGKGCRFDMAINKKYMKDGKQEEKTTYMSITCWGNLARSVMNNCGKGTAVLVEGSLETRKVEGEDGTTRKYVNVKANDVRFVGNTVSRKEPSPSEKPQSELPEGVNPEAKKFLRSILDL